MNDPLLTPISYDTSFDFQERNLNDRIEEFNRRKKTYDMTNKVEIQNPNIFNSIEEEFSGLSDEQKNYIYSDKEYQELEFQIHNIIQRELISFIKPRLLYNENTVKILEKQYDVIRLLKRKMNSDNEKLINEFKEYTEKYSDMTYSEYLQKVKNNK